MKILVAVASRHGSTHEIADALARELGAAGHDVDVQTSEDSTTVEGYDAAVIGSAVYMGNWLTQAVQFVDRHQAQLAAIPVWLFSSGPLGADDPQPKGEPAHLDQLIGRTGARGHRTFVGKLDQAELGFGERLIVRAVGALEGDFRDWPAIKVWADEIAEGLPTTGARQLTGTI
jgi:menaquinone-dependent protoporphyrinogen oxidase